MSDLFNQHNKRTRSVTVKQDAFTELASKAFDVPFTGTTTTECWGMPEIPERFGIGLIVGRSGAGKSTLLAEFGQEEPLEWDRERAVVSHFDTPEDAVERLSSVGFNSIPAWLRPFHCLSTGEKFRAELARRIKPGAVIDEFTSVIDRNVAKSASIALRRYVNKKDANMKIVLATCHYDVAEWLQPDWLFDANTGELTTSFFGQGRALTSAFSLQRLMRGPCLHHFTI